MNPLPPWIIRPYYAIVYTSDVPIFPTANYMFWKEIWTCCWLFCILFFCLSCFSKCLALCWVTPTQVSSWKKEEKETLTKRRVLRTAEIVEEKKEEMHRFIILGKSGAITKEEEVVMQLQEETRKEERLKKNREAGKARSGHFGGSWTVAYPEGQQCSKYCRCHKVLYSWPFQFIPGAILGSDGSAACCHCYLKGQLISCILVLAVCTAPLPLVLLLAMSIPPSLLIGPLAFEGCWYHGPCSAQLLSNVWHSFAVA